MHSQLLWMHPQMEAALHYLLLIKGAIYKLCVKFITAESLRQSKHTALGRGKKQMFQNKDTLARLWERPNAAHLVCALQRAQKEAKERHFCCAGQGLR